MITRTWTPHTSITSSDPAKTSPLSRAYSEIHLEYRLKTLPIWEWSRKNILLSKCSEMHHKKGRKKKKKEKNKHIMLTSTFPPNTSPFFPCHSFFILYTTFFFRCFLSLILCLVPKYYHSPLFGYRNLAKAEKILHANF